MNHLWNPYMVGGIIIVMVVVAFVAGTVCERERWDDIRAEWEARQIVELDGWQLSDRLMMVIAVGLGDTAIITDVRLTNGETRIRELELRGDMCVANAVRGLPEESGVWECTVEEWATEDLREFRVVESRKVL